MRETTEVVAALLRSGDRFLICQRQSDKARGSLWELPGGRAKSGEDKRHALSRECLEKLLLPVRVGAERGEVSFHYPDIAVHITLFDASAVVGHPHKRRLERVCWITPEEIPQFDFCPADALLMDDVRAVMGRKD